MSESEPLRIEVSELTNEPEWKRISNVYENLRLATELLHADIAEYNKALRLLDGYGTNIANGKDRIFLLKEEIARLETSA